MKTKLVYVLICDDSNYYYEMVAMSLYSFRLYHPDSQVEVVMDNDTYQYISGKKESFLSDVTPRVIDIPSDYNVVQRSRYLKTNLRQFVEGDFLYVDCDTIICCSLEEIDRELADMAMVLDLNRACPLRQSRVMELNRQAGYSPNEDEPYYNGGVLYTKDTPAARQFFVTWFQNWQQCLERGISKDQPALRETNTSLGYPVHELPAAWNCQLGGDNIRYLYKAKILHYLNVLDFGKVKKGILQNIRHKGHVSGGLSVMLRVPRLMFYLIDLKHFIRDCRYRIRNAVRGY